MDTSYIKQALCRTVCLILYILPIAYVATIIAVAVHEILGHGIATVLLGGDFTGFVLKWDGMGLAYCFLPRTATTLVRILLLMAGIIATTIASVIALYLSYFFRKKTSIQLAFIVISFFCMMQGVPYVLWNAYHPVPPGDIGKVILLICGQQPPHDSVIRWTFLTLGILLFVVTTFYFCVSIFRKMEEIILNGSQFTGRARVIALCTFLVGPGVVGWFKFDWNQVAPGIGILPCVVGALSILTVAIILFWYRPDFKKRDSFHSISWRHILVSWSTFVATVLAMVLWFADGVMWG